jgi:hypothetical protein
MFFIPYKSTTYKCFSEASVAHCTTGHFAGLHFARPFIASGLLLKRNGGQPLSTLRDSNGR